MTRRYLEDFAMGQVFASGRLRVDKKEIIAFAAQFDPQPFHLDEEAARKSVFGGLVASGWHTAALTMRLVVEGEFRPAGGVLGVGFDELNWPHPVRPGDELHTKSEVLEVRPSKSRPDRGLIRVAPLRSIRTAKPCKSIPVISPSRAGRPTQACNSADRRRQVAAFLDKMSGDAVQIGGKPARKLLVNADTDHPAPAG